MSETPGASQRGRALPRDLPSNAPTPPRVKAWYRRIMAWGFAPLMITGLVAGLVPGGATWVAGAGALLMVMVTGFFTLQAFRFRRDNQKRYDAAAAEARALGKAVRVVDQPTGNFEYVVVDAPVVERLVWPPPDDAASPTSGPSAP